MQAWDPWQICRQIVLLQLVYYVGLYALELLLVGVCGRPLSNLTDCYGMLVLPPVYVRVQFRFGPLTSGTV